MDVNKLIPDATLELVPIGRLKPYKRNSNKHPKKQIERIEKSVKRFRWTVPILCDKAYNIVAGHARYEAAKMLSLSVVPCIVRDFTDEERRAYIIADNLIAEESYFDNEMVALELSELSNFDLSFLDFGNLALDIGEVVKDSLTTEAVKDSLTVQEEEKKAPPMSYVFMVTLSRQDFLRLKAVKGGLTDKEFLMSAIEEREAENVA